MFLQQNKRLLGSLGLLVALIGSRMVYTGTLHFAFLCWNIFLALVPLYFSQRTRRAGSAPAGLGYAFCWLLFFPNAAYLITDIIHLNRSPHLLYWLDLVILYLAGIHGLYICMASLKAMEGWYEPALPAPLRPLVRLMLLALCGYGMYLGRVERWNSWDVVAQPVTLLKAVFSHTRHPFRNREVWVMSGIFGMGLWMLYGLLGRTITRYSEGS